MKTNNLNINLTNSAANTLSSKAKQAAKPTINKNNNNYKNLNNQAANQNKNKKNSFVNLASLRVNSESRLFLNKNLLKTRVLNLKEASKNFINTSQIDSSDLKKNSTVTSFNFLNNNKKNILNVINNKEISVAMKCAPLKGNEPLVLRSRPVRTVAESNTQKSVVSLAEGVQKTNLFDVYTSVKEIKQKVSKLQHLNKKELLNSIQAASVKGTTAPFGLYPLSHSTDLVATPRTDSLATSVSASARGAKVRNYIKKLSKFDPVLAKSQQLVYNFVSNKNVPLRLNSFLISSFLYLKSIISKPIYEITPNDITISLFYYNNFKKNILPKHLVNIISNLNFESDKKTIQAVGYEPYASEAVATPKGAGGAAEKKNKTKKNAYAPTTSYGKKGKKKAQNIINKNILARPFNFHSDLKKEQGYIFYFKNITKYLSKFLNTKIKFDLTRLKKPNLDSQILAVTIGLISNVIKNRFKLATKKFFRLTRLSNPKMIKKNLTRSKKSRTIFSVISGANIKLGGRLISQIIIPKNSSTNIQKGKLNRNITSFITKNRFTSKSNRGAFSITVTMGHKFF